MEIKNKKKNKTKNPKVNIILNDERLNYFPPQDQEQGKDIHSHHTHLT